MLMCMHICNYACQKQPSDLLKDEQTLSGDRDKLLHQLKSLQKSATKMI